MPRRLVPLAQRCFVCPDCGRALRTPGGLVQHKQIHTDGSNRRVRRQPCSTAQDDVLRRISHEIINGTGFF